ncbi:MAG: putative lipid-binding transport protein (Tim44 family) [Kiritimatiellia bacterium]|jgi:predicted lipid-binding transport protein (Tim44 family)
MSWLQRAVKAAPWLILIALIIAATTGLLTEQAWARVGGGQGFSSGGGGYSGGSGGGGGDGGGMADLVFLLVWLCIEYPAIGIPVTLIVVTFFVVRFFMRSGSKFVSRTHNHDGDWQVPSSDIAVTGLQQLRDADSGLSMPVLQDYLQLVHRRATEAAINKDWSALEPFVDPTAQRSLELSHRDIIAVSEVVLGAQELVSVDVGASITTLIVQFKNSRLERRQGGDRRVYCEETWTFQRTAGATSLEPEAILRMGCPSCGAAVDSDREGRCTTCSTPIVTGMLQWKATQANLLSRQSVTAPRVGWTSGGAEVGVNRPTFIDPNLGRSWRDFRGRHPSFDAATFQQRVDGIFQNLQHAWSNGSWHEARGSVTDPLYQTLRYYIEQYAEGGLRNKLADIRLIRQEIVKVELDAWYESITVRIFGSMKDWVERTDGTVVGGNPKVDRQFSEYWTFIRAVGSGDTSTDAAHCPSCGAKLDNVSAAGICGYCETKITSGKFDWVLSRIDQAEVYKG